MGSLWLLDLPDVLADAGCNVRTWPGWEVNSRSSGGLERLMGIGVHHDVSNPSQSEDQICEYHANGSSISPVGALNLGRNGRWTVIAAGATNTQGKGGPVQTSKGTVAQGNGNLWFLSIEANNNGQGEPWSNVMLDSYIAGVAAMMTAYDLEPGDVFAHFEWSNPGKDPVTEWGFRKVDPAGPGRYALPNSVYPDMFDMDKFRGDVWLAAQPPDPVKPPEPAPEPEPEPPAEPAEVDMIRLAWTNADGVTTEITTTGTHLSWKKDGNAAAPYVRAGVTAEAVSDAELLADIESSATIGAAPWTFTDTLRDAWNASGS